ncbi:MAG: bifunctional transcriptional activator/DNA repair enzyme AdaA [Saprospiraceae bacterium]
MITDPKKQQLYYEALVNRDQSFLGTFFAGVKTTGIFCIPTCRARKPKPENVDFYATLKGPLDDGFRPCKICHPTDNAHEAPDFVTAAIQLVKDNPKEKIKDERLKAEGISSVALRRWFNQHYGMTFQAYQRMFRINTAFQELKSGKQATSTALDAGYESLSGFGYTFKRVVGTSPKMSGAQALIVMSRLTTPLGPMFVCATDKGVCMLEFVDRRMLETELEDLQKRLNARIIAGENEHIKQAKKELAEYFAGERKDFEVALDTPSTPFRETVWNELLKIPFGKTCSYGAIANTLNNPGAVRAVGTANGQNRVAIIIPCHRVIGADGTLTGYGGGLERKRWLLELEGVGSMRLQF